MIMLRFHILLRIALGTQKKPSIHLSPDEHTRDLKLDEFPFVLPQPGCKSKVFFGLFLLFSATAVITSCTLPEIHFVPSAK